MRRPLSHASIQTTSDIYTNWDIDRLAATMADVLAEEENEDTPNLPDSQSSPVPAAKTSDLRRTRNQWRRLGEKARNRQ